MRDTAGLDRDSPTGSQPRARIFRGGVLLAATAVSGSGAECRHHRVKVHFSFRALSFRWLHKPAEVRGQTPGPRAGGFQRWPRRAAVRRADCRQSAVATVGPRCRALPKETSRPPPPEAGRNLRVSAAAAAPGGLVPVPGLEALRARGVRTEGASPSQARRQMPHAPARAPAPGSCAARRHCSTEGGPRRVPA